MKKLARYLAVILLFSIVLSFALPVSASEEALPSGIAYSELGEYIEAFVREHQDTTAGMAVSVFHQDDSIYTNYFGCADKEANLAVSEDTVMEWGSATKLLVWVSVMQLWEQEKIDLDTDIRSYLPSGFLTNLNYDTPITMTNLMNHNAGFQDVYADLFVKGYVQSLEDSLKAHMPEQIYEPGTVTAYSNWGVALAAYIVERISGESFDDYVHQHIFAVLGMEHSALSIDLSDNAWVAEKRTELQCYTTDGTLIPDCFYYITLYPAGMCTSTLADFETFGKALLAENSPLFQNQETWETLFSPTAYLGDSTAASNYHGFWVVPYGVETVGHGGNTAGCSSYLLLDLENKIGAVVMTNQSNETVYNSEMMELVFGEFSAESYFETERTAPEGIYRSARTVRVGPFKIISFSFLFDEWGQEEAWMAQTVNGVEKVCYPYEDFVRVPVWQFVLEVALVALWVLAVLFSVISLLVKLIRKIIYTARKKTLSVALGKWSATAALIQLAAVILFAVMASLAMAYALASSYTWMVAVMGVLALVMLGLVLYGIWQMRKSSASKKRKIYNWLTIFMLLAAVANILYWNLFMWWSI